MSETKRRYYDVTIECLKKYPQTAKNLLAGGECKRRSKRARKEATPLDIDRSTFSKCDACFRRERKCDGARPCATCQKCELCCNNVTEESLKQFEDRARNQLEKIPKSAGIKYSMPAVRLREHAVLSSQC
jgi:hypothetical protein